MLSRGLATLFACGLLACASQASAETPPKDIDLELFEKSEVDRSKGCSVVLWQHNRDPEIDKFAYLFAETLVGPNHTRQPARIKIGGVVKTLKRIAKGGKTTGYDLYEFQLYQLPAANEFVVLELKLAEEEGESVDVQAGKITVIMDGKEPFRVSVKGNAGCMTPAASDGDQKSASTRRSETPPPADKTATAPPASQEAADAGPSMFERYPVSPKQVPEKMTAAAKKQFGCEPALLKKGVTAFQLSEEAAIWQIPCGDYGAKSSAVYAIVYIPEPSADFRFLQLTPPKSVSRSLGDHALMDPVWDMKSRTVTGIHTEGNGSDCGQYERYQVNSEGTLRLVEFREKTNCDGRRMAPKDFPLVFKAK
jgi:hypothetical protein